MFSMKKWLPIFLTFLFVLPLILDVSAKEEGLVINEILPNPDGSDTGNEWIELYNPLSDLLEYEFAVFEFESESGSVRSIQIDSLSIQSESFLVIANQDFLLEDIFVIDETISMYNGGGTIRLKIDDKVIDEVRYENSTSGISLERGGYKDIPICHELVEHLSSHTMGLENEARITECLDDALPVNSFSLLLTELYPSPNSGEKEQIEVFNYGEESINLDGFYIKDAGSELDGFGTKKYVLPAVFINSNEYVVLQTSGISLNNSGDTIGLFSSEDKVIDIVSYESITKGSSAIRYFPYNHEVFTLAEELIVTLGEENPEFIEKVVPLLSIQQAKDLDDGEEVLIEGIATVDISVLGENELYIQDETGGIRLDVKSDIKTKVELGDMITILGTVDTKSGEKEVNITDEKNISIVNKNSYKEPKSLDTIDENYIGSLVSLEGEIVNNYSTSFDILVGSDEVRVSILSSTGIDIAKKSKGDYVMVTGIVSFYNDSYRILPRYQDDIAIVSQVANSLDSKSIQKSSLNTAPPISSQSTFTPEYKIPSFKPIELGYSTEMQEYQTTIYIWPIWMMLFIMMSILVLFRSYKLGFIKKVISEYMVFRKFIISKPIKAIEKVHYMR